MGNRFSERAQRIVLLAQEEAKRLQHDYVGTEHELLGLIALNEGAAAQSLCNHGVDLRDLRAKVEAAAGRGENVMLLGEIPFTPRAKKVLELAVEAAVAMGCQYVGTEHLLLGLLLEGEGLAYRVLTEIGLEYRSVYEDVAVMLGKKLAGPPDPAPARDDAAADRAAALLLVLLRNRMPYNDIEQAVMWAREIDTSDKTAPLYTACRQLADSLLER